MNNFKIHITISLIVLILLGWVVSFTSYNNGLKKGYYKGLDDMYVAAFDTIQNIMDKQLVSDSSVAKVIIDRKPDTIVYIISKKDILFTNNQ